MQETVGVDEHLGTETEDVPVASLEKVQEFMAWRRKIKPLMELLDMPPSTDLEINICSDENNVNEKSKFLTNQQLISNCEALYDSLIAKVTEKKKVCLTLWSDVQGMWTELLQKEEYQLKFSIADFGVLNTLGSLKSQLELRKREMEQRIAMFIGELRTEISDIWNQCMITEEEKAEFIHFKSNEFTEAMLDIHREELRKWQIYHKKNQEILTKITKREEMWAKLKELDAKAEDPNRFVNRGGTLLKDQNMHNYITKNLPKLEAELTKLSEKFEAEHGRKMKILGKEIPVLIEEEWKSFQDEKTRKKQARLQQNLPSQFNPAHNVPLRTRQSVLPSQILPTSSSSIISSARAGDKRPASRLPGQFTTPSSSKYGKFGSNKSLNSDR